MKLHSGIKKEEVGSMRVPFAAPDCGDEEIREATEVIKSGWLTTASRCAQFEEEFGKFIAS